MPTLRGGTPGMSRGEGEGKLPVSHCSALKLCAGAPPHYLGKTAAAIVLVGWASLAHPRRRASLFTAS